MITQNQLLRSGGCKRRILLENTEKNTVSEINSMPYLVAQEIFSYAKNCFHGGVDAEGKSHAECILLLNTSKAVFNATFSGKQGKIKCDVVKKTKKGILIYRIKTGSGTESHIKALLFQKLVLTSLGYRVSGIYLMSVNKNYVRGRILNYNKLFEIKDYSNKDYDGKLKSKIRFINDVLKSPCLPKPEMCKYCSNCDYFNDCFSSLPENNIFNLSGLGFDVKLALYNHGILTLEDYLKLPEISNDCKLQIEAILSKKDIINKDGIKEFLGKLKYPVGFLDFEAISPAVPKFKGTKANERIITQFSYHYIESENGELMHEEFIGDGIHYPERLLAEKLAEVIKPNHTVLMYSDYERSCISSLSAKFPQYKKELLTIRDNLVDLEKPFENKYLYNYKMQGKSSIKYVLPALYPEETDLDYKKYSISDGSMAAHKYMQMEFSDKETRKQIKKDLLSYCSLDTFAMVKLLESLKNAVKE